MPKNWKYIKKLLEKEFLCEKLRGHITYDLTDYRPAPWYQQHFIMKHDDTVVFEAKQPNYEWDKRCRDEMPSRKWISKLIEENTYIRYEWDKKIPDNTKYWFGRCMRGEIEKYLAHRQGIYGAEEIIDAIGEYLHGNIDENLQSGDYFVRALAVLDRRCGKRRLKQYAGQVVSSDDPLWLRRIYRLRFEAEGVPYSDEYNMAGQ